MNVVRIVVFAIGLIASAIAAAAPADPAAFVSSIYAHGAEDKVWTQWLDPAARKRWFTVATAELWAKCDASAKATNDEMGPLDFDVASNSQGAVVKSAKVKVVSQDAARAVVVATLIHDKWTRSSPAEDDVRYDLVVENGRWAIDDVHSTVDTSSWSLKQLLANYLKN